MPALITHDRFGKDLLKKGAAPFVSTDRECAAFLLGNQGPDPLFYCVASPSLWGYRKLGNLMHRDEPSVLIMALLDSVDEVPASGRSIARAYVAGFLCHYLLDRAAHPLVYSQEFEICDAGIEGLTREDGAEVHAVIESEIDEVVLFTREGAAHPLVYSQEFEICDAGIEGLTREDGAEVHAVIESEIDEVVLFTREGLTIADFKPHREILRCDEQTLSIVSYLVAIATEKALGITTRFDLFAKSVHGFRLLQGAVFHSPRGVKRRVLGATERLLRSHSFLQAMTHRPIGEECCRFDNHDNHPWTNPFTGDVSTASFQDLFDRAQAEAQEALATLFDGSFSDQDAKRITRNQNFSGEPVA